jgi:Flp pilus assembly protein TadG
MNGGPAVHCRAEQHLSVAKGRGRRRASAAVEFAVIVPFLTLLALGMIEVTRAIQVKDALTDAARSGCRQAIKPATASAAVQADINHNLTSAGIPNAYATITILVNGKTADALTAVKGDQVTVKVTVPVTKVGWLTPIFFSGQSVESEIVIMMRQG